MAPRRHEQPLTPPRERRGLFLTPPVEPTRRERPGIKDEPPLTAKGEELFQTILAMREAAWTRANLAYDQPRMSYWAFLGVPLELQQAQYPAGLTAGFALHAGSDLFRAMSAACTAATPEIVPEVDSPQLRLRFAARIAVEREMDAGYAPNPIKIVTSGVDGTNVVVILTETPYWTPGWTDRLVIRYTPQIIMPSAARYDT